LIECLTGANVHFCWLLFSSILVVVKLLTSRLNCHTSVAAAGKINGLLATKRVELISSGNSVYASGSSVPMLYMCDVSISLSLFFDFF
jgi:hypothetical protein